MQEDTIPDQPGFILLPAALVLTSVRPLSSGPPFPSPGCLGEQQMGRRAATEETTPPPTLCREFFLKLQSTRYTEQHDPLWGGSPRYRFLGQTLAQDFSVGVRWHPGISISILPLLIPEITDMDTEVWGSNSLSMVPPARWWGPLTERQRLGPTQTYGIRLCI